MNTWSDPTTIAAIGVEAVAVIMAIVGGIIKILSAIKDLKAATTDQNVHIEAAKTHAKSAAERGAQAEVKLAEIDAKTDGNASRMETELSRLREKGEVQGHMISELTTLLAAAQAAKPTPAPSIAIADRRKDAAPIPVTIVEKKNEEG